MLLEAFQIQTEGFTFVYILYFQFIKPYFYGYN